MNTTRRRLVSLALVAVAVASLAAACPKQQTNTGTKCDDRCTEQDDTVTAICIWYPASDLPDTVPKVLGEVTYTVDGKIEYNGTGDVTKGKVYTNWYHDWAAHTYPRISITCDEKWHVGLYCQMKLKQATDKVSVVIDHQSRGPKADPGSVTCSTDLWVTQHFNKGE